MADNFDSQLVGGWDSWDDDGGGDEETSEDKRTCTSEAVSAFYLAASSSSDTANDCPGPIQSLSSPTLSDVASNLASSYFTRKRNHFNSSHPSAMVTSGFPASRMSNGVSPTTTQAFPSSLSITNLEAPSSASLVSAAQPQYLLDQAQQVTPLGLLNPETPPDHSPRLASATPDSSMSTSVARNLSSSQWDGEIKVSSRSKDDPFEPTPLNATLPIIAMTQQNEPPSQRDPSTSFPATIPYPGPGAATSEHRGASVQASSSNGSSLDAKRRKQRFLMFTRVLMKFLEQKDPPMHTRAKQIIRECAERNKRKETGYESVTGSIHNRLRATVGEAYWKRAEGYLSHFLKEKYKLKQSSKSTTTSTTTTTRRTVGRGALRDRTDEEKENDDDKFVAVAGLIVGTRDYCGEAHPGEYVELVREPHHPHDKNFVRVDNIAGEKVGHINGNLAAALAPILDSGMAQLDGTVSSRGNHDHDIPVQIEFRVEHSSGRLQEVKNILQRHGLRLQLTKDEVNPTVQTVKVDWRKFQKQQLDEMFDKQSSKQLANLPECHTPHLPWRKGTTLLSHQKMGVRWMVYRETAPDVAVPFFRRSREGGRLVWLCDITHSSQVEPPEPVRGGILADDMGLGKTIQAIGLILSNRPTQKKATALWTPNLSQGFRELHQTPTSKSFVKSVPAKQVSCARDINAKAMQQNVIDAIPVRPVAVAYDVTGPPKIKSSSTGCTLIVCPVSVANNWVQQIEQHVIAGALRVATYHGPERFLLLQQVTGIDVLIASYNTLAYDFGARASAQECGGQPLKRAKTTSIFDVIFHRILLDEAHTIRSIKTRTFRACQSIKAAHRWCLTGTPVQNKLEDIHALFAFLRVEPLGRKNVFRRAVIQSRDTSGLALLRAMMAHLAIRRTKDTTDFKLAEKVVEMRSVEFPEGNPHKRIHDLLFDTAQLIMRATLSADRKEALKEYSSVLEVLLRIRQACCSGVLVPRARLDRAESVLNEIRNKGNAHKLSAEEGSALLAKLKGELAAEQTECSICLTEMEEQNTVILRACSHVFCEGCISKVAMGPKCLCPLCRKPFLSEDMIRSKMAAEAASRCKEAAGTDFRSLGPSPKMQALVGAIEEMKEGEKGVIFSQFTKFLDEIEGLLDERGETHVRIDGSRSSAQRIECLGRFSKDSGGPRFMLCSLHAAGTGINLTRANHVFLMDTWWNSAAENQAMDRCHRIGQKRSVRVVRFVMERSIEERMVEIQEAKAAIGKGVLQKLKPEELQKARVLELRKLFRLNEPTV